MLCPYRSRTSGKHIISRISFTLFFAKLVQVHDTYFPLYLVSQIPKADLGSMILFPYF